MFAWVCPYFGLGERHVRFRDPDVTGFFHPDAGSRWTPAHGGLDVDFCCIFQEENEYMQDGFPGIPYKYNRRFLKICKPLEIDFTPGFLDRYRIEDSYRSLLYWGYVVFDIVLELIFYWRLLKNNLSKGWWNWNLLGIWFWVKSCEPNWW